MSLLLPACYMPISSHSSAFISPRKKHVVRNTNTKAPLYAVFSRDFLLLGPNIFLSTLLSNNLRL